MKVGDGAVSVACIACVLVCVAVVGLGPRVKTRWKFSIQFCRKRKQKVKKMKLLYLPKSDGNVIF